MKILVLEINNNSSTDYLQKYLLGEAEIDLSNLIYCTRNQNEFNRK